MDLVFSKTSQLSAIMTFFYSIFSVHGFPKEVVMDNGTVFTSAKFEEF